MCALRPAASRRIATARRQGYITNLALLLVSKKLRISSNDSRSIYSMMLTFFGYDEVIPWLKQELDKLIAKRGAGAN